MYKIREDMMRYVKQNIKSQKQFSRLVGLDRSYMNLILNGKRTVSKLSAFAITKAFDKELEIADLFEIVKKEKSI